MQTVPKLHPLITYSPTNQSIQLHQLPPDCLRDSNLIVSIIEARTKDYNLIFSSDSKVLLSQPHGVYISSPIWDSKTNNNTVFLLLPPNQNKISEKYQDLFASIALMMTNVCLFDISSKFVRQSKNVLGRKQRSNYVVMGSHSSGGQIYKANVCTYNNKMQISSKISTQDGAQLAQLGRNVRQVFQLKQFMEITSNLLKDKYVFKSYLNFEQMQLTLLGYLRLHEHLRQNSKQYGIIQQKRQKLSMYQFSELQKSIDQFQSSQFSNSDQSLILSSIKKQLKKSLHCKNKQLNGRFLDKLKNQYFLQVRSLSQLQVKKQLALKILEQYGIESSYCNLVYCEVQQKLNSNQINRLNNQICLKDKKIKQLSNNLSGSRCLIKKYQQIIKRYQEKNLDFKQLNNKFQQKCQQLNKQRQCSKRLKGQVESLLLQLQRRQSIQESLHKVIKQGQESRQQQNKIMLSLQDDIKCKENCIVQLQIKNEEFESKIKNYQNLEGQAWKSIQQTQTAKDQLQRFKQLLHKLEGHFDAFKRGQAQKFNYILARNAEQHAKLKKQCEQKSAIIEQYRAKVQKLCGELQQQKCRLKFCQDHIWAMTNRKSENSGKKSEQYREQKSYIPVA